LWKSVRVYKLNLTYEEVNFFF